MLKYIREKTDKEKAQIDDMTIRKVSDVGTKDYWYVCQHCKIIYQQKDSVFFSVKDGRLRCPKSRPILGGYCKRTMPGGTQEYFKKNYYFGLSE